MRGISAAEEKAIAAKRHPKTKPIFGDGLWRIGQGVVANGRKAGPPEIQLEIQ
jgi:hypothetical protein